MPKGRLALAGSISAEKAKLYGSGEVVQLQDTEIPTLTKDIHMYSADLTGGRVTIPTLDYTNRILWYLKIGSGQLPTMQYRFRIYQVDDPNIDDTNLVHKNAVVTPDGIVQCIYIKSADKGELIKVDENLVPTISKTFDLAPYNIQKIGASIFLFGRDPHGNALNLYFGGSEASSGSQDATIGIFDMNTLSLKSVKSFIVENDPWSPSGLPTMAWLYKALEVPDGYILVGRVGNPYVGLMLIKTDFDFNVQWAKTYLYESSGPDITIGEVKLVPSGIVLVGTAYDVISGSGTTVAIVMKLDLNGNLKAIRRIYQVIGVDVSLGHPWIDESNIYFAFRDFESSGNFLLKFSTADLSLQNLKFIVFSGDETPPIIGGIYLDGTSLILTDGQAPPTGLPARIVSIDTSNLTTVNWAKGYSELSSGANMGFEYLYKTSNGYAVFPAWHEDYGAGIATLDSQGSTTITGDNGDVVATDIVDDVTVSSYIGDHPPVIEDVYDKVTVEDITDLIQVYTITGLVPIKDSVNYVSYLDL